MKQTSRRDFAMQLGFAALSPLVLSVRAPAAEWPAKPVRIVVPFAPGGAADTAARLYAEPLGQAFGKQFVIENRAGGGGIPAAEAVARAEPDGHTLVVSGIPIIVVTSFALSGDDVKAFEAGCDAYVTKPFSPRALLAKIREYLP